MDGWMDGQFGAEIKQGWAIKWYNINTKINFLMQPNIHLENVIK